ncbi:MAG TPA: hypothetical protein VFH68_13965 [Polyangia bacterium]|jgi:hypothetical protein|nr:hypothetical protein [Polyangia bacterium]
MLALYLNVLVTAARHAVRAWPAALSLVVYGVLFLVASILLRPLGMAGGFLLALVVAACWSSYLELISQAVAGLHIRLRWEEFKRSFAARFWDVISVMFAFFIIGYLIGQLTAPLAEGPRGPALSAILAIATAFFFNAVPELLYQGHSRSFALLLDSGRFMLAHPVVWLLPNVVFAAAALAAGGGLHAYGPAELLITFGTTFSSPMGVVGLLVGLPRWSLPIALFGLHYVMIFRGLLFAALTSGTGNARLRAFQAASRR